MLSIGVGCAVGPNLRSRTTSELLGRRRAAIAQAQSLAGVALAAAAAAAAAAAGAAGAAVAAAAVSAAQPCRASQAAHSWSACAARQLKRWRHTRRTC
eukprot:364313-Chlamydomonas_euryale.AAC.1